MPTISKAPWWKAMFVFATLFALTMAVLPQPPLQGEVPDKWLHALAFAVLTILARLAFPRRRALTLLVGLSALGALIELMQAIPASGRDASLADWVADILAVIFALGLLKVLQVAWPTPASNRAR